MSGSEAGSSMSKIRYHKHLPSSITKDSLESITGFIPDPMATKSCIAMQASWACNFIRLSEAAMGAY